MESFKELSFTLPPSLLTFFVGAVLIGYLVMTVVFFYHWHRYGERLARTFFMESLFLAVSLLLVVTISYISFFEIL